jgi:hypothetical protein
MEDRVTVTRAVLTDFAQELVLVTPCAIIVGERGSRDYR